jgi:hypothetical protein
MALKKYRVEVTRVDEYIIEIDTDVWNEGLIQQFNDSIYESEDAEDIAKHLATSISCQGKAEWMEGFGYVKQRFHRMEKGELLDQYKPGRIKVSEDDYYPGLMVEINAYDEDLQAISLSM